MVAFSQYPKAIPLGILPEIAACVSMQNAVGPAIDSDGAEVNERVASRDLG
jgi:hypothetical protein